MGCGSSQQAHHPQQKQQQGVSVQQHQGGTVVQVGGQQYLIRYQQQYQWQMTPQLNKELLLQQSHQAFDQFDQDKSGNLNLQEFYNAIVALFTYQNHPAPQKQLVDHLLEEYDYSHKVNVSRKDFRSIVKDLIGCVDDDYKQLNQKIKVNKQQLDGAAQNIFLKYDQDRSGSLNEHEFFGAVCEVFAQMQLQQPQQNIVHELLDKHDSKGKGKIKQEVFAQIVKDIYETYAKGEKKTQKEKFNKEHGKKKKDKKKH